MFLPLVYFYSFVFLGYIAKSTIKLPYKRVRFEIIVCFILLFVFFGFRDLPVLNDTAHYYEHFDDVLKEGDVSFSTIFHYNIYDRFSLGYQIYERIIGAVFGHPYMIICISALIITISFLYFAKVHTKKVSFLIFMCLTTFMLNIYSGLRQGLAVCIFLFALILLEKKKFLLYYVLVLLAFTFHTSAVILFVLPILMRVPLNKFTIFITISIALASAIGINYLVELAGLNETNYFDVNKERASLPIGSILNSLVLFFVIVTSYRLKVQLSVSNNETTSLFWWISLLTLFFSFLDTQFPILGRFCLYFNIIVYTLFLYYINMIKHYNTRQLLSLLLVFFLLFRMGIILGLKPEWYHLDSYAFFDFSTEVHDTRLGY